MNPEAIERMIEQGRDSYEARLAAGQARLKRGEIGQAVVHLERASEQEPGKTMAWQSLGEAYLARGQVDEAGAAWDQGIEVAAANGDSQAEKVMRVFRKRLDKRAPLPDPRAVFAVGRLLALPTETVYGLAAPIDRAELIERVFSLKGRPMDHPLIVHVGSVEQARSCVSDWPDAAEALSRAFWPGPLTLVLPRSERISLAITGGQATVALRMPDHPLALRLLAAAGVPMVAPSANRFTRLSPTRAGDVAAAFSSRDVEVVDGGPCQVGIESTIVALDAQQQTASVLRPGMIAVDEIAAVLPPAWRIEEKAKNGGRSPGQMAVHYRPERPLRVEILSDGAARDTRLDALRASPDRQPVDLPAAADQAARALYAALRQGEQSEAGELVVLLTRAELVDPAWAGIVNRLKKAASRWIEPAS